MIVVKTENKENYFFISVKGHSGYDDSGKDIVCAAISTAVIITAKLLKKLDVQYDYLEDENIPIIELKVKVENMTTKSICNTLVESLEEIETNYSKYLKIKKL